MEVKAFDKYEFFTGVPDSLLQPLNDWIYDTKGVGKSHIVAANEGNAVAIAAGYHLATGKIPLVYLQNSGLGNIINPVTSLTDPKVYGIPLLFVVGWRGEPDVKDEPQHIFQGEITLSMLDNIGISYYIIDKTTTEQEFNKALRSFEEKFGQGHSCCFVVKKGVLSYENKPLYKNNYTISREDAIKQIIKQSEDKIIISTTGKISRELYEARIINGQGHERDFLTVGSMGHCSSIALGIAYNTNKDVIILDGDGAALMHMGSMAVIGQSKLKNLTHIVLNNSSHESVGGMPTVAAEIDFTSIAKACGYAYSASINSLVDIDRIPIGTDGPKFIEIRVALGSRGDLLRPKESPKENKDRFKSCLLGHTGGDKK